MVNFLLLIGRTAEKAPLGGRGEKRILECIEFEVFGVKREKFGLEIKGSKDFNLLYVKNLQKVFTKT